MARGLEELTHVYDDGKAGPWGATSTTSRESHANVVMVQKLAYHQSPSITSRYDHRTEGAKQRAAATSVEARYCLAHCLAPVVRR